MKKIFLLSLLSSVAIASPEIAPRYDVHGLNIGWKASPDQKSSVLISCASSVSGMDKSIYLKGSCADLVADAGQRICLTEMESTLGISSEEGVRFRKCSDR